MAIKFPAIEALGGFDETAFAKVKSRVEGTRMASNVLGT
jgi:hypothetical protein